MEIRTIGRRLGTTRALLGALLACSVVVTAACGNDDESAAPTSAEPPGSAQPSASTNELADGSGCTPPSETDLPDGRWYGSIDEAGDGEVVFDLACFFTGDPAVAASAEDGEESPPPNGYHVRNANELLRTLDIETEAPVAWYPSGGGPADFVTVAYGQWRTDRETRAWDMGVWLTISGGIIVEVEEQWTP